VLCAPACARHAGDSFRTSGTLDGFLQQVYEKIVLHCSAEAGAGAGAGARAGPAVAPGKTNPLRVFLPSLGGLDRHFPVRGGGGGGNREKVLRFLVKLKHFIRNRDKCITVVISSNAACHDDAMFLPIVRSIADCVLIVESFDGGHGNVVPIEYRHFCAFFHVLKLSNNYALSPHHPPANHYGIQRDSRKLLIELLHLPPEEGDDESEAPGKKASGGGGSCSASVTNIINEI
jgi:hypothetical protein